MLLTIQYAYLRLEGFVSQTTNRNSLPMEQENGVSRRHLRFGECGALEENHAFALSFRHCLSKRVPHTEPLTLLSQPTMTASAPSFATPHAFLPKRENG